jgi:TonB family protein
VVDVGEPDPARDRRPETSRFLSQRDSAVEKETRSRHAGLYQAVAPLPTRAAPSGAKGEPATAPEPSRGRKAVAERRELALRLPAGDDLRLPEARPGVEGERDGDYDRAPAPGVAAPPGTPDGSRRKLDLRPGAALMEQLAAGPAADHLPDVEEGEGTFLNTSQWKYAGYFNRIGQQLQVQWRSEGQAQVEARDPTGQRFMYRDRLVVMDVTLDDHGVVRSVRVVRSTGVDFLDRVAEDMFRKAEAFANPPAGMVDASGRISLTFGINFVGTAPSFGLVRRPSFHD